MKTAIVVFTKVPKAGETKTRLTTEREGVLTAQEAKELYEGCLLDVVNACLAADCGDFYICYNRGGDLDSLKELLAGVSQPQRIKEYFTDMGGTFDECMQYAGDYILKSGGEGRLADSIVIIGGDLPSLQPAIVRETVARLESLATSEAGRAAAKDGEKVLGAAIVEGACQEGGFSIIGYTHNTPFEFDRVFYNADGITALDVVLDKAAARDIPFGCVQMVPDVDIPVDLGSMIPVVKGLALAARYDSGVLAPANTVKVLQRLGLEATALPPER